MGDFLSVCGLNSSSADEDNTQYGAGVNNSRSLPLVGRAPQTSLTLDRTPPRRPPIGPKTYSTYSEQSRTSGRDAENGKKRAKSVVTDQKEDAAGFVPPICSGNSGDNESKRTDLDNPLYHSGGSNVPVSVVSGNSHNQSQASLYDNVIPCRTSRTRSRAVVKKEKANSGRDQPTAGLVSFDSHQNRDFKPSPHSEAEYAKPIKRKSKHKSKHSHTTGSDVHVHASGSDNESLIATVAPAGIRLEVVAECKTITTPIPPPRTKTRKKTNKSSLKYAEDLEAKGDAHQCSEVYTIPLRLPGEMAMQRLVIGIDVGSTFSGYAYNLGGHNDCFVNNNWAASRGYTSLKAPTAYCSYKDKTYFGFEAFEQYDRLQDEFEMDDAARNDIMFCQTAYYNPDEHASTQSEMLLLPVCLYLVTHCCKAIKNKRISFSKYSELKIILTLGNNWNGLNLPLVLDEIKKEAQKVSGVSAVTAGTVPTTESELRSCLLSMYNTSRANKEQVLLLSTGGNHMEGKYFVRTEYSKTRWQCRKHRQTNSKGSQSIDRMFVKELEGVLGKDFIRTLIRENASTWYSFMESFSHVKNAISPRFTKSVTLPLDYMFGGIFKDKKGTPLAKYLKAVPESGFSVSRDGKFAISGEKMRSYFVEVLDEMKEIVQQFKPLLMRGGNNAVIYFMGGLAESPLVKALVVEELGQIPRELVIPENSSLCAVCGTLDTVRGVADKRFEVVDVPDKPYTETDRTQKNQNRSGGVVAVALGAVIPGINNLKCWTCMDAKNLMQCNKKAVVSVCGTGRTHCIMNKTDGKESRECGRAVDCVYYGTRKNRCMPARTEIIKVKYTVENTLVEPFFEFSRIFTVEQDAFFNVMILAGASDKRYRMTSTISSFGEFIDSINGLADDREKQFYWRFLIRTPTTEYYSGLGASSFVPADGQHLVWAYQNSSTH